MKVLFVAAECAPLAKTGGLGDVIGALPKALAAEGLDVRVLLPGYPGLAEKLERPRVVGAFDDLFGGPARLRAGAVAGLDLLLLDAPHLYDRPGGLYLGPAGRDWPDNAKRFAALSRAAATVGRDGLRDGWRPDVIHGHDWHAGLTPVYLGDRAARPATVLTIHNIAYQGGFPRADAASLGLPPGEVNFLRAGLEASDIVTTVSPRHARELTTPAMGMGLDDAVRARGARFVGVLNGIDRTLWDPAADPCVAPFDAADLERRQANRDALIRAFGLTPGFSGPLYGVVSRLDRLKGLDLLAGALPQALAHGGGLVLLGDGDAALAEMLTAAAARLPGRAAVRVGFDEPLARLIYAGADALVIPSRMEPCGLTQLYAMRYGAVPIAAETGGLSDTIVDAAAGAAATGFLFAPDSAPALAGALDRAAAHFAKPRRWRALQQAGMARDFGWGAAAAAYAALYRRAFLDRA